MNGKNTSFRNDAHAFPEFIGNKYLLSHYECDHCNKFFSETIEDHFAKYMGPARTISQISGKKGVPTSKSHSGKSSLSVDINKFEINTRSDDDFIKLNNENKQLIVKNYRQPYIPRNVFKCLVKMALTILPDNKINYFRETIKWLMIKDPSEDKYSTGFLKCLVSFASGISPTVPIIAILFYRKDDKLNIPYISFYLTFVNYTFQIFLPFSNKDSYLNVMDLEVPQFPNINELDPKKSVKYNVLDLSSKELIKDERISFTMSFDEIIALRQ